MKIMFLNIIQTEHILLLHKEMQNLEVNNIIVKINFKLSYVPNMFLIILLLILTY